MQCLSNAYAMPIECLCLCNAYAMPMISNFSAYNIDVLFPGQIFICEFAYKFCCMFPFDMYIFNKRVRQRLWK